MMTFDQVLAEKLNNFYIGEWPIGNLILCAIALLLSVILCGAIGLERERRGRTAGLRTHLLVGLGSCIIMIISIYGFPEIVINGVTLSRDVARLAAQVITGVGFLGAGAIIHRNDGIKGLTTAATIWIVMAIGLACGSFNFILAIGSTLIILLALTVFKKVETRITKTAPTIILHVELGKPIITNIMEASKQAKCEVKEFNSDVTDNNNLEIVFRAIAKEQSFNTLEFISKLQEIDGVLDVDLLNSHKM